MGTQDAPRAGTLQFRGTTASTKGRQLRCPRGTPFRAGELRGAGGPFSRFVR